MRAEYECLEEPARVREMPLGGTHVRHAADDIVLGIERLAEPFSLRANRRVAVPERTIPQERVGGGHWIWSLSEVATSAPPRRSSPGCRHGSFVSTVMRASPCRSALRPNRARNAPAPSHSLRCRPLRF